MLAKNPLPDFSRTQWVSSNARSVWEPRITAIGKQFDAAERASIGSIRPAALQNVSPDQFPVLAQRAAKIGLVASPIGYLGHFDEYVASAVDRKLSEPWEYRVALTMPRTANKFIEAWQKGDDETIGRLLGYPPCCCSFFLKTWGDGSIDPTWHMEDRGDGPIEANILLRWLGVRYIPHLPCGFRCDETIMLGKQFRAEIPKLERGWMDSLLSMPMLWTSLNGIGELVTPIFTLNFRSDIAHELREIRRQGSSYPEGGAHALRFPYLPAIQKCLWTDNGFSSREAMEAGHEMIISVIRKHMESGGHTGSLIDLGAGNGELLRKLGRGIGLESDTGRVDRRVWNGVRFGRIQDAAEIFCAQRFAVAIISARRFEELNDQEIRNLGVWLEHSVDSVIVYQYDHPQFARLVIPCEIPFPEISR